jgi:hypothetical protein
MGIEVPDESELDIVSDAIEEAEYPVEVEVEFGEGWGSDDPTDPKWYDDSLTPSEVGSED